MEQEEKRRLTVHMLGRFSVQYGDEILVLGRNSASKLAQLLQIIWLSGEKGIGRDDLAGMLYDRDSLSSLNNSLNNLIYRLRRVLPQGGFPPSQYVINKDGVYFWDSRIPVWVDAREFKNLVETGERMDREGKDAFDCFRRAEELYQGELLSANSTENWVIAESLQLKRMYERVVSWLGKYLKKQRDYPGMYRIYRQAAQIYPFDGWQTGQIESMVYMGNYKEAFRLYDQTARRYSEEMGLPPSDKMLECYRKMSQRFVSVPDELERIREEMRENSEKKDENAYYCSYPSFIDIYRVMTRRGERDGQPMCLMLCTLVDYEGKVIQNQEKLKARSEFLKAAIGRGLRRGDVYARYSASQYLILLSGVSVENSHSIGKRISRHFKILCGQRGEINFSVSVQQAGGNWNI